MLLRPVFGNLQAETVGGQIARGGKNGVAGDHDVALGANTVNLRGNHVGLCVEHVQRGALSNIALFDHAVQRQLCSPHQFMVGGKNALRGLILAPCGNHGSANLVTRDIKIDARLAQRFLVLAHLRRSLTALVDRNGQIDADTRAVARPVAGNARRRVLIAVREPDRAIHLRQESAFGRLHAERSRIDLMLTPLDGRVGCKPGCQRTVEVLRQKLDQRVGGFQIVRRIADELTIDGRARRHRSARGAQLRQSRLTARFRLRHIGARALSHIEARTCGAHLLFKEFEILRTKRRDLAITNHVHIGACGVEERVEFLVAQPFIRGAHTGLGRAHIVARLETIEDRLRQRNAKLARPDIRAVIVGERKRRRALNARAHAGLGNRNVFIRHPHAGAFRVQGGVVLIGFRQSAENGFGGSNGRRGNERGRCHQRDQETTVKGHDLPTSDCFRQPRRIDTTTPNINSGLSTGVHARETKRLACPPPPNPGALYIDITSNS
ncbi:protein of unknown function [Nitratireductor aquimarinus]